VKAGNAYDQDGNSPQSGKSGNFLAGGVVNNSGSGRGSKVNDLWRELKKLRKGAGLREPGRLNDCPTLIRLAASIRGRTSKDDLDPLLDARDVLLEAAQQLPEDEVRIFNMAFALSGDSPLREITARREDLALALNKSVRSIYDREERILKTVAVAIVSREEETQRSKAREPRPESVESKPIAEVEVNRIAVSLLLDSDGMPVSRKTAVAITAQQSIERPIVVEFGQNILEILDTVGCWLPDYKSLMDGPWKQLQEILSTPEWETAPTDMQELASDSRELIGEMLGMLPEMIAQESDPNGRSLYLPSLKAGGSHEFSYVTTYITQQERATTVSDVHISDLHYGFFYAPTPNSGAFVCQPKQGILPRLTIGVKLERPVMVVPYTPEVARLTSSLVIPVGSFNFVNLNNEGEYQHTFYDVSKDEQIGLMWSYE
jgi:hypothetical protein